MEIMQKYKTAPKSETIFVMSRENWSRRHVLVLRQNVVSVLIMTGVVRGTVLNYSTGI